MYPRSGWIASLIAILSRRLSLLWPAIASGPQSPLDGTREAISLFYKAQTRPMLNERAKVEAVIDNIFNRQTATKRLQGAPQHNEHQVAIIDPGGFIRGYHDLRDEEAVTRCLRDIGLVVNRGF